MQAFGPYVEGHLFSHIPYAYIKTNRKLAVSTLKKGFLLFKMNNKTDSFTAYQVYLYNGK